MLRSINQIEGYILAAEDGEFGQCKDFLWDDRDWIVRYLVADTGRWLPGRKVLISPISLGEPSWTSERIPVQLTKKQIENSPGLDQDAPVSRQYEIEWFQYYGYPPYWGVGGLSGPGSNPGVMIQTIENESGKAEEKETEKSDPHLRSANEVTGYRILAKDGEIGHVEDFIVEDETWAVRYVVIDTRNWLPGRKVLISPSWIQSVSWEESRVQVDLPREMIRKAPEYDPSEPVNRVYEARLYDFYGRPHYW